MLRHNYIGNALAEEMCCKLRDTTPKLIYCDWIEEQGDQLLAEHLREWVPTNHLDGGDGGFGGGGGGFGGGGGGFGGDGDGGGGFGGDGDGGDGFGGGSGFGGGDGDGGFGDGGFGGGDGGGGFGGDGGGFKLKPDEIHKMKDGLIAIVTLPGGYYPYVAVGRLKHIGGLEWEIVGSRIIRRFGNKVALSTLAAKGPQEGTNLLPASEIPMSIWRPNVGRCEICNEEAWLEHIE